MANDPNQNRTAENIANLGYNAAGVYSTGMGWMSEALFAGAYQEALAMGLEGTAATQYANQAAENALTNSGATVGKWLPFIGAGLSLWDIAESGANFYNVSSAMAGAGAGIASLAGGSASLAGLPGALVGGYVAYKGWRTKEKWEKGRKRLFFQNSEVMPVGQDGEGWTYLRLSNGIQPGSYDWGDEETDTGFGIMLRYNPETNELQQTRRYQPSFINEDSESSYMSRLKLPGGNHNKGVALNRRSAHLTTEEWSTIYNDDGFVIRDQEVRFPSGKDENKSFIYAKNGKVNIPEEWINKADYPNHKSWNKFLARNDLDKNTIYYVYDETEKTRQIYRLDYTGSHHTSSRKRWGITPAYIISLPEQGSYEWETFDPSKQIDIAHHDRHVLMWNIDQLQASIYNNVLVPQGLAPKITSEPGGWQQITSGENTYLTDGRNVADIDGKIFGSINSETGAIQDLDITSGWRFDSDFEKPRNDKPPPYNIVGTVDGWDQVKQSMPQLPVGGSGVIPSSTEASTLLPSGQPSDANFLLSAGLPETGPEQLLHQQLPDNQPQQPTDANFLLSNNQQPQSNILGKAQQLSPQQLSSVSPISSVGGASGLDSIGGGSMSDRTAEGQQQTTLAPGPLPAGGAAIWDMYLNNIFGSPGQGQPSYLAQSLADQQQWLDEQNQQYVDAIQQNVQPYNQAINTAQANPINISFGGQPVGNVMMQGGINTEQQRIGANMLAPAAQWDYAQQNTPSTAYLQYANVLAKAAMDMEKMAYGIPSSNVAGQMEGPEEPLSSQVGNWLNVAGAGLGALQTGMNIYDFGQNQNWWGGSSPSPVSSGASWVGFQSPWV